MVFVLSEIYLFQVNVWSYNFQFKQSLNTSLMFSFSFYEIFETNGPSLGKIAAYHRTSGEVNPLDSNFTVHYKDTKHIITSNGMLGVKNIFYS